jgi:arylsulfatase A-like enzyme
MIIQRRQFLKTMAAPALAAPQARAGSPNILIVMADQHRAGLTRRTGFAFDTMPVLDRLAASGVAFDRAYTTAPLCVPARVSMLTGRWPHAHRVRQNSAARFALFEKDLFQTMKTAGYRTALVGKNHSYLTAEHVDFFRSYSHLDGWLPNPAPPEFLQFNDWMKHLNHGVSDTAAPFSVEAQFPHRIVTNAIEFIGDKQAQPFAMWVSFPEPHNPYQVPKPYFDMFPPASMPPRAVGPEALQSKGFKWQWLRKLEEASYPGYDNNWRRTRSNYLGMLRLIDDQIGRLTGHLQKTGQLENTIVIYLTDHGDFFCDYGLNRKGVGLPEALTRIPMVWSGPGIRPQTNHPAFVSTADIFPTLCEAAGIPMPHGVQGRSLWPLLKGEAYPKEEFESIYAEVGFGGMNYTEKDTIPANWGRIPGASGAIPTFDELNPVTQSGNMKMVRVGEWKLTFDMMGNAQLYNLEEDPYELKNLYGSPAAAAMQARMTAELLKWTIRTQDDLPDAAYTAKRPARNWYASY